MITVSEASERIITRSRYLSEAISKGLINLSSLARYIKPEVEEMLQKEVSDAALIMALNRLSQEIKPKYTFTNVFKTPPDMIVRLNLFEITVANSERMTDRYESILRLSDKRPTVFLTTTKGIFETTIIASDDLKSEIKQTLKRETVISEFANLAAITIRLPKEAIPTPGIFYFFLKSLAWEGINIIEVVSSYLELTIVLDNKEVNRAFAIMQSLFSKQI